MAALRVVLSKSKSFLDRKLGLLGGSRNSSSVLDRNSSFHSRFRSVNQSCRHYFLPPTPAQTIVEFGGRPSCCCHYPADTNRNDVLSLAECAVQCHNKETGGADLRFVRVVRVSVTGCPGRKYYHMTLEAFDKKANKLNVYYAVVFHRRSENIQRLERWTLVDESFRYPFAELRFSERWRKSDQLCRERNKNYTALAWFHAMAPPATDYLDWDPTLGERIPDLLRPILDIEKKSMPNSDGCQPRPPEYASDPGATVASDFVATVYEIEVYWRMYRYASTAVDQHNQRKNEDDEVYLEEVLWASKRKAEEGAHYFLLLEAMDKNEELRFYYAVIKAYRAEVELIEWHPIEESSIPLQQEE